MAITQQPTNREFQADRVPVAWLEAPALLEAAVLTECECPEFCLLDHSN